MGRVFQRKRAKGREGAGSKMAGWYAHWRDEHGREHLKKAGATQREAKEYLAEVEAEVEAEVIRRRKRPGWQADSDGATSFAAFGLGGVSPTAFETASVGSL